MTSRTEANVNEISDIGGQSAPWVLFFVEFASIDIAKRSLAEEGGAKINYTHGIEKLGFNNNKIKKFEIYFWKPKQNQYL